MSDESDRTKNEPRFEIPPMSRGVAGTVAGVVVGSIAGPLGAVVGGVVGALAAKKTRKASRRVVTSKRSVQRGKGSSRKRGAASGRTGGRRKKR